MLRGRGELFHPAGSRVVSADPADTKFLQCAQAAQADYIVTATSGISPPHIMGLRVNAGELLDRITLEI